MSAHTSSAGLGRWFKSSYSNPAQDCVEVRFNGRAVQVRDSKNQSTEPVITVAAAQWSHFVSKVTSGGA